MYCKYVWFPADKYRLKIYLRLSSLGYTGQIEACGLYYAGRWP